MRMAGHAGIVINDIPSLEGTQVQGILTQRTGDLQAEMAGQIYTIHAHLLTTNPVKVGQYVGCDQRIYLIINAIKSPNDPAYSCDLTLYQAYA